MKEGKRWAGVSIQLDRIPSVIVGIVVIGAFVTAFGWPWLCADIVRGGMLALTASILYRSTRLFIRVVHVVRVGKAAVESLPDPSDPKWREVSGRED